MSLFAESSPVAIRGGQLAPRECLVNQVGREEAAEKPFLEERRCTSEANEKMVWELLAYSSDTL
jgi:hypothetical protein